MVCLSTDLDKLDNEKRDLIQSDIAALHHFYSKHLEFPDNDSLVVLFAQVSVRASGDTWFSLPCQRPSPGSRSVKMNESRMMASP